jgi:hypothetical protein
LGGTLLSGLMALGFGAKVMIGIEFLQPLDYYPFEMGRRGQVLVVRKENDYTDGRIQSITDLAGQVPEDIAGERLNAFAFRQVIARGATAGLRATSISYRGHNRFLLEFKNETTPSTEAWWYAVAQGRVLGYDKQTKRLIGSFGPEGFVGPGQPAGARFKGEPALISQPNQAWARYPLAFPDGAFTVDFRKGKVAKLFTPPPGEIVLWASQREDEREKWFHRFVGTVKTLHVFDEAGTEVFSAPLVRDMEDYRLMGVGRLDGPRRFWVWYIPKWQFPLATQDNMFEAQVVIYDQKGGEILPRQKVSPRRGAVRDFPTGQFPSVGPSCLHALSGLATSPVELATLLGMMALLESEARQRDGMDATLPLPFVAGTTQLFVPGILCDPRAHLGLVCSFAALMLLAAAVCGLACFLLPRRYAFSRARRIGWALCGLLFGPTGLLLMIALLDWPALITCPKCRKLRVATRQHCEHCGAAQALPEPDGTEIFEENVAIPQLVLATR